MDVVWLGQAISGHAVTVIAAVVTALLTTLVVEYFAKPRLEARKERLIRDRRQIDEVVFGFQMAGMLAGSVIALGRDAGHDLLKEARITHLADLSSALDQLQVSIGRLPSRYVIRHSAHLSRTARFLGVARATVRLAQRDEEGALTLEQVAEDMSLFDTYFLVHVDFRDSQEHLIKRWFWKRFTARSYAAEAARAVADRYGG